MRYSRVMAELHEMLEQVADRATFVSFVKALEADRRACAATEHEHPYGSPGGWEQATIEDFLEAAVAWAEASQRLPSEPTWHSFAEFLYAGKIYE